ncbi:MAG TPA: pyrimidine 5'-nucleotidase [Rhodocyclaceae bacterium]|nr:pyrimidine 5'-nucleotidase [Rhodocyclaceae bacterium]HRQ46869.1 pyrimidine 5'-nucleotidase [Rhodocyclaceae bacterium]
MNATTWLFDLDNTLHNASAHIFPHINRSMTAYLQEHLCLNADEANALRLHYWHRYGATLLGLMRHHGTDPRHFLEETHRFDGLHRLMVFDRALRGMLRHLPGRKIVFSNGPQRYARAVVGVMGIRRHFHDIYGIEQMRFHPKPGVQAFRHLLRDHRLHPHRCVLVEDSAENLRTAKRLGMKTVLVSRRLGQPAYVDLKIDSILDLRRVAGRVLA